MFWRLSSFYCAIIHQLPVGGCTSWTDPPYALLLYLLFTDFFLVSIPRAFLNVFFWLLFFSFYLNFHKLISFGLCFKNSPDPQHVFLELQKNNNFPSLLLLLFFSPLVVYTQWVWKLKDNFWELVLLFHLTWDLKTKFRCWTFMVNAFTFGGIVQTCILVFW